MKAIHLKTIVFRHFYLIRLDSLNLPKDMIGCFFTFLYGMMMYLYLSSETSSISLYMATPCNTYESAGNPVYGEKFPIQQSRRSLECWCVPIVQVPFRKNVNLIHIADFNLTRVRVQASSWLHTKN